MNVMSWKYQLAKTLETGQAIQIPRKSIGSVRHYYEWFRMRGYRLHVIPHEMLGYANAWVEKRVVNATLPYKLMKEAREGTSKEHGGGE